MTPADELSRLKWKLLQAESRLSAAREAIIDAEMDVRLAAYHIDHFFPATYCGVQRGYGMMADIELWDLTRDIPGHSTGSTVSRQTLEKAGYIVPSPSLALIEGGAA